MKPDRWQQLKQIFGEALEKDPADRAAFLDHACAGENSLREEVESLLASHRAVEGFLEEPVYRAAPELLEDDSGNELIGVQIGPYSVKRKIKQGGMGIVYLGEDTRLRRPVAIKALAPQHTADTKQRERLKREAQVAATLAHPAIATIYALEEHDGDLYIVSEYVRGRTLLEELSEGSISLALVQQTGLEIAKALAAAHERGIIHRDLKPENVMRTPEGAVKVLDFGLAKFQAARRADFLAWDSLTQAGTYVGTPAYSSPEQLLGLEVDFRTDIFSFGIMLYELASGTHPFAAADSITTLARILEAEPADLNKLRPAAPPRLDQILRRCLQKKPAQRYSATAELVADLEQLKADIVASEPLRAARATPESTETGKTRLTPRWWWQLHQAGIGVMYYLMLYPMWMVKEWTPGSWGALLFFLPVAAVGVAANLRFHLWFTSRFYPSELAGQRRRVSRWIRSADVVFVASLLAGAMAIHNEHAAVAMLLVGVAVYSLGASFFIEPTTTRAALDSAGHGGPTASHQGK